MSWEMSCTDMCRACMKVDGVLLPMYDDDTISRKNLPMKLAELTSVQIDRFDGLPNKLCAKCAYRTDAFYDFRLQVQASEKKLRKMFETQLKSNIKMEEDIIEDDNETTANHNELAELKSVESKFDKNSSTTVEHSEQSLPEMITANGVGEQALEIDVSELVQANGEIDKNDLRLRNMIISKMQELEGKDLSNGIPDELSKLLASQNLDYTIMYIPESDIDVLDQGNDERSLVFKTEHQEEASNVKEETELGCSRIDLIDLEQEPEVEYLHAEGEGEEEDVKIVKDNRSWQSGFSERTMPKDQSKQNGQNGSAANQREDCDTSDSDYFVDPKDNILGSLNDTITRIKEIKVEGDVVQFQCTLCLQNYDKLTGVLLHTIDNHVPSSGPFFCVVCEKDCETHRELRTHVKTHTGQYPYSCFICNKAYSMKRYLKRHMVCHTDFPRHRCPKCGHRFKTKSELEAHVTTHIRGAPYACSQCPRVFNHKGNYKRHLITHLDPQGLHLPKYPCKVCGKRFLNNRTLETHMRVHTGEKPFKCEVCGRSFSQQGNLLNHARIHSNPRSYTCEVCGKRFNQRATLRDHGLLHTGEKPYVCNVCGVAFTFSAALRRHMWTHSGGKPFGCEECSARFVGKYDLRRHMRVHTDRPRVKRRRNVTNEPQTGLTDDQKGTKEQSEIKEDHIVQIPSTETVLIEQVLLTQDVTQVVQQQESEKENVDALFNLIQYG